MRKISLLTASLITAAALAACSNSGSDNNATTEPVTTVETPAPSTAESTADETEAETSAPDDTAEVHELKTGQALFAAHGTKSFATATVIMDGETIVLAYIDEYQFMDAETTDGVPNSENFTDYVSEGYVLGSKRVNSDSYSTNMAAAGSTVAIYDNFDYIQEFVAGKTVSELEALTKEDKEAVVDAVSGATLVDTSGYLQAVLAAAEDAAEHTAVSYEGDLSELEINQTEGAAHGTKCFTLTTTVTGSDQVVSAFIDEFQYLSAETSTGVPNSENFTDYVAGDYVLASKRVNAEAYSTSMAAAGSTVAINVNYDMIQEYVSGKTISELKELEGMDGEEVIDAVSGATLADTPNYIAEIVRTVESGK